MESKKKAAELEGFEQAIKMFGEEHVRERLKRWERMGELGELLKNFSYKGLYGRTVLDLKTRELCGVAALTAVRGGSHLKSHIRAALRVGATPEEVKEAIFQTAPYCGTMVVTDGFKAFEEVMAESKNATKK